MIVKSYLTNLMSEEKNMSLDIYLSEVQRTITFSVNITHNLAKMADAVPVSEQGFSLYQCLWAPEQMKITKASQLIPFLTEALAYIQSHKAELIEHTPANGWGSIDNLFETTNSYRLACMKSPEAEIEISR